MNRCQRLPALFGYNPEGITPQRAQTASFWKEKMIKATCNRIRFIQDYFYRSRFKAILKKDFGCCA